jgi:hypothetical protein
VGSLVGYGVGLFSTYDGINVGVAEGAAVGETEGYGVGLPGKYVGTADGDVVGSGVGDPGM